MLTRVDVVTDQGAVLTLPLWDASLGYLVKEITGLDPVKATITASKFARIDGTARQASSREHRNIVLKLGYTPDYVTNDIQRLRTFLYKFVMPKSLVLLRFYMNEVLFVQIRGEVESCETPLFSREPEVDISIVCFQPDFVAPEETLLSGTTAYDEEFVIEYPGSTPTGFEFELLVDQPVREFQIHNRQINGDVQILDFLGVGDLIAGDIVNISTVSGDKKATLTRGGVASSALYMVSPASAWVNLMPGSNMFRIQFGGSPIPYSLSYVARYGGL